MLVSYYDILGVSREATREEIRAAYREQVLRHHPDKCHGQDAKDADQSTTFTDIKEAYEVLIDDDKREEYDKQNCDDTNTGWLYTNIVFHAFNFIWLLRDRTQRHIRISLPVTLEDIYFKRVKKLNINVRRRIESSEIVSVVEEFYIPLNSYEHVYVFDKKGDDCIFSKFESGDVIVTLDIQSHPLVRIDNLFNKYDLFITLDIGLVDHYFKEQYELQVFKGLNLYFRKERDSVVLREQGLPFEDDDTGEQRRGDIYIYFNVILPQNKTDLGICLEEMQKKLKAT